MRGVGLWMGLRASSGAAYQRLRREWRRLHHATDVRYLSSTAAATSGGQARLSVSYADDTPVTMELRHRIEDLESARDQMSLKLTAHDRRLDEAQRSHDELASGGVFVQAASVVLVVLGSAIATASPWLTQIGWWGVLVFLSPVPLIWLVRPE
jgi:hypothetical protein